MRLRSLLCLLLATSPFLAPARSLADDFADFRIPENRYGTGALSFTGFWDRAHQHSLYDRSSNSTVQGDLTSAFAHAFDADTRHSEWRASTRLRAARQGRDETESGFFAPPELQPYFNRSIYHNLSEQASVATDQRWYPSEPAWFVGVGGAATLSDIQMGASGNSRGFYSDGGTIYIGITEDVVSSYEQRFYNTGANVALRTGWGRVRNASAVYDARVLEDRLLDAHVLRQPLSRRARQRLASLLYAQNDVVNSRGRPAGDFWEALEVLLQGDNALGPEGLTARSIQRAIEPYIGNSTTWAGTGLPTAAVPRLRGWLVSTGVVLASSRQSVHDERHRTTVVYAPGPAGQALQDDVFIRGVPTDAAQLELALEYHRPLSQRVQCDLTGFGRQDVDKHTNGHEVATAATATWMVADRWWAACGAAYSNQLVRLPNGTTRNDVWHAGLGAEAHRYVAEHYSLDLAWSLTWDRRTSTEITIGDFREGFSNDSHLTLGFSYRFAGFASIPGIFPAALEP